MCMALLGRVFEAEGNSALIDFGGVRKNADARFLPVKKNDYVYVFNGFIIERLTKKDAEKILKGELNV